MKKILKNMRGGVMWLVLLIQIISINSVIAQTSSELTSFSLYDTSVNIREKIRELDEAFSTIIDTNEGGNKANYTRWRRFLEPRLTKDGKFYNVMEKAYVNNPNIGCPEYIVVNNCETQGNNSIPSNWKSIGTLPNGIQKQGRVCAIWNNPTNTNNIMIGTSGSGLWKTNNGLDPNSNWTNLTDVLKLPGMGVSSIIVKPDNPNIIWISTAAMFWNYGFGIFKSLDGGATWCYQPLEDNNPWPFAFDKNVFKIVIDPTNYDRLACISSNGLYATIDGGVHWVRKFFIPHPNNNSVPDARIDLTDLEIDPSQTNRLFISTTVNGQQAGWGLAGNQTQQCKLFRIDNIWNSVVNNTIPISTDLTTNVALQSPNINTVGQQRINVKIRQNGELVASCSSGGYLLKSNDHGSTWTKITNNTIPFTYAGGMGKTWSPLVLDPLNPNHFYMGGTELIELYVLNNNSNFVVSPNGYQYFATSNNPNTHADIIELKISNNTLFVG
jgi:hypothetical protein